MLHFDFLKESNNLPLSFAPLKELRSLYRFLRLFQEEISSQKASRNLSFDFILEDHKREYTFPVTFLEFEKIIRDQGRYAKTLHIIDYEEQNKMKWLCRFDLEKNQIYIQSPPKMEERIETLWRIARKSYGL